MTKMPLSLESKGASNIADMSMPYFPYIFHFSRCYVDVAKHVCNPRPQNRSLSQTLSQTYP